ncbi:L-rhamnose mutarotase [Pseudovibrio sp. Tun.PSC04-5.I4]|uniref:L-rhamnose mutarotase n=1 Tax=Pseudovibrio sp. Tun.PSC04-5.I4 TaxID=1798213 RepID=UPI0008906909|nr:L-rhamnose mutarotase [Pseudovibrio sp. Tun.PSC04-5.I4]SDQ13046.1 L-rhamnose mutarotase [Pseudovibrio sp. Tun.PSC04-5.I4]
MSQKIAFKMKLKPGYLDDYKKRHEDLWPELKELFASHGISDFTIHFDSSTNELLAVHSVSGELSAQDLGSYPIVQKWWAFMADIMETYPDGSPVTTPLKQVFHLK